MRGMSASAPADGGTMTSCAAAMSASSARTTRSSLGVGRPLDHGERDRPELVVQRRRGDLPDLGLAREHRVAVLRQHPLRAVEVQQHQSPRRMTRGCAPSRRSPARDSSPWSGARPNAASRARAGSCVHPPRSRAADARRRCAAPRARAFRRRAGSRRRARSGARRRGTRCTSRRRTDARCASEYWWPPRCTAIHGSCQTSGTPFGAAATTAG